ncbi:MAG: 2-phospho-L-lactate transferase [Gammaproteobacteria bacterium]|nr:2-phospho-L-lactate transferase [Gammaproteobacteria bacterium]
MNGPVVALSGGIGGAKLALGLARVLPPGALTVIANTGDDFEHLGLAISPDLDTLLYTLAELADPLQGWGRRDETWNFMETLRQLGGETWFALGDRDLALHVERTRRLAAGATLAEVTEHFRAHFGIAARILPMSDAPVRTRLRTAAGWLDFQDYFVRRRCAPAVGEIQYAGAATAAALPAALAALADPALRAIVICPSNPLLSVGPMLAIPALRSALQQARAPVIAVSPLIGGRAIKGPTAKLMQELGLAVDAAEVARGYAELIDVFVADEADAGMTVPDGVRLVTAPTLMTTLADRERLARAVLQS